MRSEVRIPLVPIINFEHLRLPAKVAFFGLIILSTRFDAEEPAESDAVKMITAIVLIS